MFSFDSGYLFGRSVTQPNATPVRFGSLQGVEANWDFTLNRLPLNMQAPAGYTISHFDMSFKAQVANVNGLILNQLLFGSSITSGSEGVSRDQSVTVPSTGPYTVTPTVPNSGTWSQDLGAQYNSSGVSLVYVASSPAQGQYSVSGGTYTFNAADAGQVIVLNYLYTMTTGNKLALPNNWQGLAPVFSVVLNTTYNGQQVTWRHNSCASKSLRFLMMLEKINIPDFTFQALGDTTGTQGNIGTFSYSE